MPRCRDPAWSYFAPSSTADVFICRYPKEVDGKKQPCGESVKLSGGKIGNGKHHLRMHPGYDEKISPHIVLGHKREKKIEEYIESTLSEYDWEAAAFACMGASFRACEEPAFRRAYAPHIKTGELMKKHTIEADRKLLAARIKEMPERHVVLAVDSGTVNDRFLAVAVHSGASPAFMLGMKPDTSFPDKMLSSKNIRAYLLELIDQLKKFDVKVVGVVLDNAANMQSSAARINGIVWIRCAAHLLALIVKDIVNRTWLGDVKKVAMEIYKANSEYLPAPVETRWNSFYRLVVAILDLVDEDRRLAVGEQDAPTEPAPEGAEGTDITVEVVDDDIEVIDDDDADDNTVVIIDENSASAPAVTDNGKSSEKKKRRKRKRCPKPGRPPIQINEGSLFTLQCAVHVLGPLNHATDFLQADRATAFDMTLVFGSILAARFCTQSLIAEALADSINNERRAEQLTQPLVLAIAYYSPNCSRRDTLMSTRQIVADFMLSLTEIYTDKVKLADEMKRFYWATTAHSKPVTYQACVAYWMGLANAFPELSHVVRMLVGLCPTEASVERLFSVLKDMCNSRRTNISEEGIVAQLRLKSLMDSSLPPRKSYSVELEIEDSPVAVELDRKELSSTRVGAIFALSEGRETKLLPLISARNYRKCKVCEDHWYNHVCRSGVVCSKCKGFFMLQCLPVSADDYDEILAEQIWVCYSCTVEDANYDAADTSYLERE